MDGIGVALGIFGQLSAVASTNEEPGRPMYITEGPDAGS